MKTKTIMKAIAAVSLVGILFSGFLTYNDYTSLGPAIQAPASALTCTSNSGLFGLPVCVYGLAMYTVVFALAVYAIKRGK
jgi:uncharacterized membrane protein